MKLDNLIMKLKERQDKLNTDFTELPVRYRLPDDSEGYAHAKQIRGRLSEIGRIIEMLEMSKTLGAEE